MKEGNIAAWEEILWGCTPWGFCPVKNISKSCGVQHVGLYRAGTFAGYKQMSPKNNDWTPF